MTGPAGAGKWGYPPVPAPGGDLDASAPPLPAHKAHIYDLKPSGAAPAAADAAVLSVQPKTRGGGGWFGWGGKQAVQVEPQVALPTAQLQQQAPQPAKGWGFTSSEPKAVAIVAPPKIEAQPWVKSLWRGVAAGTIGILRVDLRRPT
jgi:hypothetical protein